MNRPGFSLVEALTALVLAGVLTAVLGAALAAARRAATSHNATVERAEARRVAAVVIAAETRSLRPGVDMALAGPSVLELRAVRGVAIPCGREGDAVLVRYRGMREAEPLKDSVLAVGREAERAHALEASAQMSGLCTTAPGEQVLAWRLDPDQDGSAALFLLYERGSYHLAEAALRYRRGQAGRQPLTPEVFRTPPSAFTFWDHGLEVLLVEATPASRPPARLRIVLLNGGGPAAEP